jgi:two-component system chemotaxis sensor kinase CheA
MRVDIDRLDLLMNLAGELVVNRAQFLQVVSELSPGLKSSGGFSRAREFIELLKQTINRLQNPIDDNGHDNSPCAQDWSANIRELEVGIELIEDQAAQWEKSRRSLSRLDEAIDQLSRVSDSLQRGVLGARMVPVGPLLARFKRVVRDLSVERDKDVVLEIDGEATELDKRMVDALGDPLVHLVRNSIDHGLERTEDRIAAGKPAQGKISLSAKHRGNHVYIMVSDDGAGINDQKIRQRLVARGIVNADVAMSMSRSDAIDFIWHPGFSTAEAVTDVSGRGVGMDIVKSRIEELTGTIEIDSVPGQGTTFTLKLPLTLAIISSLLVRIRGIVFAIPMDDVREIVSVADTDVLTIRDKQAFEVRGQYLPLLSIDSLLTWNSTSAVSSEIEDESRNRRLTDVAILQSAGRAMGLRVDELIGSQDVVIKSLTDHFIGIHGLAGASILGDGTVALMLDVAALLMMSVQPRQALPTS